MTLRVRLGAQRQIGSAADWYETQCPGLGNRFLDEIDGLLDRIEDAPAQFPLVALGVRRGLVRTFPFAAYFTVLEPDVIVLAVLHLRRDTQGKWN